MNTQLIITLKGDKKEATNLTTITIYFLVQEHNQSYRRTLLIASLAQITVVTPGVLI